MFNLTLTNGYEDLTLSFKVRDSNIAQKWFCELQKNYPINNNDRFTNRSQNEVIPLLNNCIDTINSYDYVIDRRILANTNHTQDDLNYLHNLFEQLRGKIEVCSLWYNNAPTVVQEHLEKLNNLIHELEDSMNNDNQPSIINVTFKDCPRIELAEEDYQEFTFNWTQGTVYIDYCHVGKTILDIFRDKDVHAQEASPQTHYSADFKIKLERDLGVIRYTFKKILLKNWLSKQCFNFKHLSLGMIPVADIATKVDVKKLRHFKQVKSIECNNSGLIYYEQQ